MTVSFPLSESEYPRTRVRDEGVALAFQHICRSPGLSGMPIEDPYFVRASNCVNIERRRPICSKNKKKKTVQLVFSSWTFTSEAQLLELFDRDLVSIFRGEICLELTDPA